MKIIPILFSTPMVQAILSGNKSMTRRTKGLDFINEHPSDWKVISADKEPVIFELDDNCVWTFNAPTPYGQPGDVLWVRERFCNINKPEIDAEFVYFTEALDAEDYDPKEWKWKPGIHMPFEACRIFLRVTNIRVERLQDISEADAKREGIAYSRPVAMGWMNYMNPARYFDVDKEYLGTSAAAASFFSLWVSINGEESLMSNPWVWVVSFERITNHNEIAAIRKRWDERRGK